MTAESSQESRRQEQAAHFTQNHIDIAVLRVIQEGQTKEIAEMAEAMKAMSHQLATMNTLLSEARGGWKVVMAVAGAASVLGGMLSWAISHVTLKAP